MSLSSHPPTLIGNSSLKDWKVIGSGGFGKVYRARHHQWGRDVAVKLLHYDDGSSRTLLREIEMMRRGSSPNVIQVLGVFEGRPPFEDRLPSSGPAHLGLVMEVMERGSLASLQVALAGALPWSLVFRLAHQVALGINFLHSLSPAVLHLDLKPSNVLLDSHLNAKLTDFGLSRIHHSVSRVSKNDSGEEGGTYSYMPPEAFNLSYNPTRASDIYSYGILLWSIVTGKEPYANFMPSLVQLRIPKGDRPSLDEVRNRGAECQGLTELMSLMERCWDARPKQRPSAHDCITETEQLYNVHELQNSILDAVYQVLKKLDKKKAANLTEQFERVHISDTPDNRVIAAHYDVPTGHQPVQEMAGACPPHQRSTTRSKALSSPRPASFCDVTMDRSPSPNPLVKASSVQSIQSSPGTRRLPPSRQPKTTQPTSRQTMSSQYHHTQRQLSIPDISSTGHPATGHIHISNVTGLQCGNNNNMHIYIPDNTKRRRHPTAP